jgi:hypothetical protein
MKRPIKPFMPPVLMMACFFLFSHCSNDQQKKGASPVDSEHVTGTSQPDNNSANNPSLADTAYEKNHTRPVTDTMKSDTMKKR